MFIVWANVIGSEWVSSFLSSQGDEFELKSALESVYFSWQMCTTTVQKDEHWRLIVLCAVFDRERERERALKCHCFAKFICLLPKLDKIQ